MCRPFFLYNNGQLHKGQEQFHSYSKLDTVLGCIISIISIFLSIHVKVFFSYLSKAFKDVLAPANTFEELECLLFLENFIELFEDLPFPSTLLNGLVIVVISFGIN